MFVIARSKKTSISNEDREIINFQRLAEGIYSINYKAQANNLKYTKEQIIGYINTKNATKLRQISQYFYDKSGLYKRLINHFSDMLTLDYLVVPRYQTFDKSATKNFEKNFNKLLNFTDNLNIKESFGKINEIVLVEGVFFGYLREFNNTNAIQQLPINFCRTRFKVDGNYGVEFNVRYFDTFSDTQEKIDAFNQFPEEFLGMYLEYKENKRQVKEPEWFIINPEYSMCFQFEDIGMPFFVGIFEDLIELESYKAMEKSKDKLDLIKLIVQKLPLDDKKQMTLRMEEAEQLHKNAKKMLSNNDNIDVLTTPTEVEAISLQDKNQSAKDNLMKAERSLFNESGTSSLLFNATGNLSLKYSVESDEAIMFKLLAQYSRWLNSKINYLIPSKNYNFEIFFPQITVYNQQDVVDSYTKNIAYGYPKIMVAVASGLKQSTFNNLLKLENDYLKLPDNMIPANSSHTSNSQNDGGRPQTDEQDLSDSGNKTRDNDENNGRI